VASLTAFTMIAHQVGGKAARDALFLSSFEVTALPYMIMGSAIFSVIVALAVSRLMSVTAPARLMPAAFTASGLLQLAEWALVLESPRMAAVAVYLHFGSLGAVLISGFWSVVNERFDPRSAKRQIGKIAGAGTFGGLVGGFLAERVAATLTIGTMLPVLAVLHLLCALAFRRMGSPPRRPPEPASGMQVLKEVPYLRSLGGLVLLATCGGVLVDYFFKAQASAVYRGEDLMRFFGIFYGVTGLLTFMVQTGLSRISLQKLGLAQTVATLPAAVAAGSAFSLLIPGLWAPLATRASEMILRSSLFRSGYELLFTPISRREKRATKQILDVGSDRLGDLLGGGAVRLLLLLGPAVGNDAILWTAIAISSSALVITSRLGRGYVHALEQSLMRRAIDLDVDEIQDMTTRSTVLRRSGYRIEDTIVGSLPGTDAPRTSRPFDPMTALQSGDPGRVRQALRVPDRLDRSHVPYLVPLLASPELASEALATLRRIAPRVVGQLTDFLLDPEQDFTVRRRLPRVLASVPSKRAIDGLLLGLEDQRFEVRYQCGRSLASIREKQPGIEIPASAVLESIKREVSVGKRVWDSQRMLEGMEETEDSPLVTDVLRVRANRSLEHVFTLLSLILPKDPLRLAWLGLHTRDELIRGTALEYLESVLPEDVRELLWPYLEDNRVRRASGRTRDQILADLVNSNPSLQISLAELEKERDAHHENAKAPARPGEES
jgi:ATP/ADP translocase